MRASRVFSVLGALCAALWLASPARAKGTATDYERANGLRAKYEDLAVNVPGAATWIEKTHRFWYRRSVKGGHEFVVFDADSKQKRPAFDHEKLAASLSTAAGGKYTAVTLPFNAIAFADDERAVDVTVDGAPWKCTLADYTCTKDESEARRAFNPFAPRRQDDATPRVSPDKNGKRSSTNPSSTMQVVNQLIKHNKDFDLLYILGAGHGAGGAYGEHKRFDFFVRELLGVRPPAWTKADAQASTADRED